MATKKLAYRRVVRDPQTSKLQVVFIDAETGQIITDLTGYEIVDQGTGVNTGTPTTPTTPTEEEEKPKRRRASSGNDFWDEWYAKPTTSKGSGDIIGDMQKAFDNAKTGFDKFTKPIKDTVDAAKEFVIPGSSGRVDAKTGLTDIPPVGGGAATPNLNAADPLAPTTGAYSKATWVKGNKEGVDPALLAIIDEAALRSPYIVQLISGNDGRPTNPGSSHPQKKAVDIQLVNPDTGEVLPNYQDPTTFRAYEQFAQTAKLVQETRYPQNSNLAWGGYFWNGGPGNYGNMDVMHFSFGEQMGAGNWAQGLVKGKTSADMSVGMSLQDLMLTPPGQSPIPELKTASKPVTNTPDATNPQVAANPMPEALESAVNTVRSLFSLPAVVGSGISAALNNVPAVPKEMTEGLGGMAMNDAVKNWNEGKGSISGDITVGKIKEQIPNAVAGAREAITGGIESLGQTAQGFMPNAAAVIAALAGATPSGGEKIPAVGTQTTRSLAANTGFMNEEGKLPEGLVSPEISAPFSLADPERRDKIARTLIGEAVGEGYDGMMAVANVIKNRAMSGDFPVDPLDVVLQNVNGHYQFSAWNAPGKGGNDLVTKYGPGTPEYEQAAKIADLVFSGQLPDNTGGAVRYHTTNTNPYWAKEETNPTYGTYTIGNHVFYPNKAIESAIAPTTDSPKAVVPSTGFVAPTGGTVTSAERDAISAVHSSSFMSPTSKPKTYEPSKLDSSGAPALPAKAPMSRTVTPTQRNAIEASAPTSRTATSYTPSSAMSVGSTKAASTAGAANAKTSTFMSSTPKPVPKTTSSTTPNAITAGATKVTSTAAPKVTTPTGSTVTKAQMDAIRK